MCNKFALFKCVLSYNVAQLVYNVLFVLYISYTTCCIIMAFGLARYRLIKRKQQA